MYRDFFMATAPMGDATTLETFVDRLLEEKGVMGNVAPEVLDEMREDLLRRVEEFLNAKMVAALPQDKVEELNALLEEDPEPEDVHEFFTSNVENFPLVFANAFLDFRAAYVGA